MRSRWLTILALLLALAPGLRAAADCAGWQATSEARRACCAAGQHHCPGQSADNCCGSSQQRQQRGTQDAPVVAHKPATAPALDTHAIVVLLEQLSAEQASAIRAIDLDVRAHPSPPLHRRLVQLLI